MILIQGKPRLVGAIAKDTLSLGWRVLGMAAACAGRHQKVPSGGQPGGLLEKSCTVVAFIRVTGLVMSNGDSARLSLSVRAREFVLKSAIRGHRLNTWGRAKSSATRLRVTQLMSSPVFPPLSPGPRSCEGRQMYPGQVEGSYFLRSSLYHAHRAAIAWL